MTTSIIFTPDYKTAAEAIAFIESIRPHETSWCIWHEECFVWEENLEKYVRVNKDAILTALRHKMTMEIEIHWNDDDGGCVDTFTVTA